MKKLKKFIASVLIMAMAVTATFIPNPPMALAEEPLDLVESIICPIEEGCIYVQQTAAQIVTLAVDEINGIVEMDIVFANEPDNLYQVFLDNTHYGDVVFDYDSELFWSEMIALGIDNLSSATLLRISDMFTVEEFDEIVASTAFPQARGAAQNQLIAAMQSINGKAYSNKLLYTDLTHSDATIKIYEDLIYNVTKVKTYTVSSAITISSFIVAVIMLKSTSSLINAIGIALGIVGGASVLIPAGKIVTHYRCTTDWLRKATISGSSYIYNMTDKFINYNGIDNETAGNSNSATLDNGSADTWYSHSSTYFNTYSSQSADAYAKFKKIGLV